MSKAMDGAAWAIAHHAQARDLFRTQLVQALGVHLPLAGEVGHLTHEDLERELLAAVMLVNEMRPGGRAAIAWAKQRGGGK